MARRLRFLRPPFKPDVLISRMGLCNADAARIILTVGRDSIRTCQVDIIYGEPAGNEAAPSRSGNGSNRRRSVKEGREELDVISRMDSLEVRTVIGLKEYDWAPSRSKLASATTLAPVVWLLDSTARHEAQGGQVPD